MANFLDIIGAVESVLGLGNRIYQFFRAVKDAPEEVRQMCAQLQLLQKLFQEIMRSTSDLIHVMPLSLDIIMVCMKGFESEFNTVWLAIEPLRTEPGIVWSDVLNKIAASVKWVVKTEEFEKLTRSLERGKQTLALAMLLAGMRVDSTVLERLSSIDTKLDEYGRMLDSHLHNAHMKIAFQLRQLEYRFLQRVDVLSGAVDGIHGQNSLRVTDVYDSITPNGPPQDGEISRIQSVTSDMAFTVNSSETPDINLVGSTTEAQRTDVTNQAIGDNDAVELLPAAFRDAIRQWKAVAYPNKAYYPEDVFSNFSLDGILNQLKRLELDQLKKDLEELQAIKRHSWLRRFQRDEVIASNTLTGIMDISGTLFPGVRLLLEVANREWDCYELVEEALREMQHAIETCTREYELYPEPRVKIMLMRLYTDSFSGMTAVLRVLQRTPSVATRNLYSPVLRTNIKKIQTSSREVLNEVEYLHRKELRQAHLRLREVDRKQDQVIRALEEQRKILNSMQEEHKALSLISDHQKVLQMLQQLLAKFPPSETSTVSE